MRIRRLILLCFITAAGACATSGPNRQADFTDTLSLCGATRISNAPAADRSKRIANYTPYKTIRGVSVARAPVSGCLSSGFGPRRGGAGFVHKGIDIFTRDRRPVFAAADGHIAEIGKAKGFGRTLLIRHRNGVSTRYAHLSSFASGLRKGARLRAGQVIGRTGDTGNATAIHLHYEIRVDGVAINPLL